jgi:hypothetical protein
MDQINPEEEEAWWYSTYPQDPEMLFPPPNSSPNANGSSRSPPTSPTTLPMMQPLPNNPYFPPLPDDRDDWALPPLQFESETCPDIPPPRTPTTTLTNPVWMAKDMETLRQHVLKPLEGKLGGRVSKYLKTWQATCGGETFIALGMRSYWKDTIQSPERLRNRPRPKEYKFTSQQEAEFQKLLNDQIEQGIVIEVSWDYPAYLSPVFTVIKKSG